MDKAKSRRRVGRGGAVTGALALLLILCLAECASGSCLSYGHSCWGAHGKRSFNPPANGPDWFLNKLIRQVDANNKYGHRQMNNDDISTLFQAEAPDDSQAHHVGNGKEAVPVEVEVSRIPVAKPMLDDDLLAKINFWQMMKEASGEK